MDNNLNNKLKDFGKILDQQLKESENSMSNAMKNINGMNNPALEKLSKEFIANAKAGNPINVDAYLKEALEYASRNNSK